MNRIRELRDDKGLKQCDVAKAVGIDQRTLSNYETGKTNPDSFAIIKLAEFFNVSTDYLLGHKSNFDKKQISEQIESIINELNKIYENIKK